MKRLTENQYFVCKLQGKVFELSLTRCECSSSIFIRRFMNSEIVKAFENETISISTIDQNNVIEILEEEYGKLTYGKKLYSPNEMFWIGYFYRVLGFYFDLTSKAILRLLPPEKIRKFYYIGHTFDPEYAAERIIEETDYDPDYTKRGIEIYKELLKEKEASHLS